MCFVCTDSSNKHQKRSSMKAVRRQLVFTPDLPALPDIGDHVTGDAKSRSGSRTKNASTYFNDAR